MRKIGRVNLPDKQRLEHFPFFELERETLWIETGNEK
jgi:hypothetical protein